MSKSPTAIAATRALVDSERIRRGDACEDCAKEYDGYGRRWAWHHRDPASKDFQISVAYKYSTKRALAEIAKCDFLCAGCHLRRHRGSPEQYPDTGSNLAVHIAA